MREILKTQSVTHSVFPSRVIGHIFSCACEVQLCLCVRISIPWQWRFSFKKIKLIGRKIRKIRFLKCFFFLVSKNDFNFQGFCSVCSKTYTTPRTKSDSYWVGKECKRIWSGNFVLLAQRPAILDFFLISPFLFFCLSNLASILW